MSLAVQGSSRSVPRAESGRRDVLWPVGLTSLAFVVRLIYVMSVTRHELPGNDTLYYHIAASSLALHNSFTTLFGQATLQWPPGYPFLLSLVYRFTSENPFSGEVVNAVFGALTVPLVYFIAKRILGRSEAIVAAAILTVLPGQILWTDVLLSETFYTFLLVAYVALLVVAKVEWRWVLVIGALSAVAALTRGEGFFLVLIALAVWSAKFGWRRALVGSAVVGVVCLIGVAPWTLRNYWTTGKFVLVSANDGPTLYSGHNPNATGAQTYPPLGLVESQHFPPGAKGQVATSNFLQHEAFQFMLHNPKRELELIPLKLLDLNRGDSHALDWVNVDRDPTHMPIKADLATAIRVVADASYYALLALTILSVVMLRRPFWRDAIMRSILVWFATSLAVYGFLYYGNYRYRSPLEPLMILVSAPLIVRLWSQRKALMEEADSGSPIEPAVQQLAHE